MGAGGRIAIIDYGSGNLRSVQKAVERVANTLPFSYQAEIVTQADDLLQADYIILPGVGAFGACVAGLRALVGMEEALNMRVRQQGRPFLGICVGMQLMASRGIERGEHKGLGWIDGTVVPFWHKAKQAAHKGLKIPHMGWNELMPCATHKLLDGVADRQNAAGQNTAGQNVTDTQDVTDTQNATDTQDVADRQNAAGQNLVYFVHSFVFEAKTRAHVLAQSDYGGAFAAIIGRDNMIGTQFHPEKSQTKGLQLLANFLQWRP